MLLKQIGCLVSVSILAVVSRASDGPPLLRKRAAVVLDTQAAVSPGMKLTSRRIGSYATPLSYELIDAENRLLSRGILGLDAEREVVVEAATPLCLLQLDSGLNGYTLHVNVPYCFVASKACNLRVNRFAGKLYFYVPHACKRIDIRALCQSPKEGAKLQIIDPEGGVRAAAAGEIAKWERLRAKPPAQLCGRAWALDISEQEGFVLDDVDMYIAGDVPPLFALKPEWVAGIAAKLAAASLPSKAETRR